MGIILNIYNICTSWNWQMQKSIHQKIMNIGTYLLVEIKEEIEKRSVIICSVNLLELLNRDW